MTTKLELFDGLRKMFSIQTINGKKISASEIEDRIAGIDEVTQHCNICEEPSDGIVMFIPGNSQEFGAAPGKTRQLFYGSCNEHVHMVDAHEKIILERLQIGTCANLQ